MKTCWCIKPSVESVCYDYDAEPQTPWLGAITERSGDAMWVSRVCEDGTIDDDANATSICSPSDLYETEQGAFVAWKVAMQKHIDRLERELINTRKEFQDEIHRRS